MSTPLTEFNDLKARVEAAKQASAHAAGALSGVLERLKKEHGCDSIEEAKKLLAVRGGQAAEAEKKFTAALAAFKAEHGAALELE